MTTEATDPQPGRLQSWPVRAIIGLAIGLLIILAMLRLQAANTSTENVLDSADHISVGWALLAIGCEALAYCVPPLILARLVADTPVRPLTATRITFAAIGVGNLVPGQPAAETLICYRELHVRGVSRARAVATPLVMAVAVPAAAMALLAGPLLLISGAGLSLPEGWRVPVLTAGSLSAVLGIALVTLTLVPSTRTRMPAWMHLDEALETMGGPSGAAVLMGLAFIGFSADALALLFSGRAVGANLPVAALPVAYIVATVAMAVPFLPGGLGAVEVAVPLVFSAAGATYAPAVLAVLAWRVLQFWIPTLAGLACYASLLVEQRRRNGRRGPSVPAADADEAATPRSPG
jgi:putative heme transporter